MTEDHDQEPHKSEFSRPSLIDALKDIDAEDGEALHEILAQERERQGLAARIVGVLERDEDPVRRFRAIARLIRESARADRGGR